MTPHTHVTSTTTGGVPVKVAAVLADLDEQYRQALALPHDTPADAAVRAAALALICARRAGWWRVLSRWTYTDSDLHRVFGKAVIAAEHAERDRARFWRDMAADWRARAEGRRDSGLWAMWDDLDRGQVA